MKKQAWKPVQVPYLTRVVRETLERMRPYCSMTTVTGRGRIMEDVLVDVNEWKGGLFRDCMSCRRKNCPDLRFV